MEARARPLDTMPLEPGTWRRLPQAVEAYRQAQRLRLSAGERLRTVALGRTASTIGGLAAEFPEVWPEEQRDPAAAALLLEIRKGRTDGPVPLLGRAYRRLWEAEDLQRRALAAHLEGHPAWAWLRQVKGIAPTLAARLLARLDIERTASISSLWAHCGLATVPGVEYRCADCGLSVAASVGAEVAEAHERRLEGGRCAGKLRRSAPGTTRVRVAQPKPAPGDPAPYDEEAKQVCYALGISMLRARGGYERFHRHERDRLDREKPSWAAARREAAALRRTEKLLLAHLWLVWRSAASLPSQSRYAQVLGVPAAFRDPWRMADRAGARPAARPDC